MKDECHPRVSMLENLGILDSSARETPIKLDSDDHGMKIATDNNNKPQQQKEKQTLKSMESHTEDAKANQIISEKRILHLLEMTDGEENHPQALPGAMTQLDSLIQRHLSEQPTSPTMQLQPGAHAHGGLTASESSADGMTSESFRLGSASYPTGLDLDYDANHNHHGLVTAHPVTLPTHSAEPMEPNDCEPPKGDHLSRQLLLLLGACILVVGIVFLVIFLQDPYHDSDSSSPSVNESVSTSPSPTPWTWDLPFTVPALTVFIIERDINRSTPQAKAYDWMKSDPYLATYSEERLLQRFVMVVFYYATMGQEWTYQGGGTVTIDISLGQKDRPGPARRQLLRHLQQQQPANTTSAPVVRQGGGPSQGGSIDQGNQMGKPPTGGSLSGSLSLHPSGKVNLTSEPWLSYHYSECEWFSSSPTKRNTTICSDSGEMHYLSLDKNNLGGILPPELGLLSGIKALEVSTNQIGGQVISELGTMSDLQELQLLRNLLTGTIPSQLGRLKLLSLSILTNLLTGTVPLSIWRMSTLKYFRLGQNELSGSLPDDIGTGMPEVVGFYIPRNQFTGTLPVSLGFMTHLEVLVLTDNKFSHSVPTELGKLTQLNSLLLDLNQLSGVLPSELGQLTNLSFLKLDGNPNLGGTLPTELAALNRTLGGLLIKDTSITGTIPEGLCGIQDLSFDCSTILCGCNCSCEIT